MDAGEAAHFAAELKSAMVRYGVRPQNKIVVKFMAKDLSELEITLDPGQLAINTDYQRADAGA